MSLFTALNSTPHDALLEAEEHSRELQVEESFRVFQSALFHLKAKRFDDAEAKFEQLFNIEVLKPDHWGLYRYSSPTLDLLRYLAYRNHGVFYYQYVREHADELDKDDIVDYILKVVENLLQALQHSDGDAAVTGLLLQVFRGFKSKRLQRWILEYELTKQPEEMLLLGRGRALLPDTRGMVEEYRRLLRDVRSEPVTEFATRVLALVKADSLEVLPLPPVLDKIEQLKEEDDAMMKQLAEYEVNLEELSWECIAESFRSLVPKYKYTNFFSKAPDPYSEAGDPIECIKFVHNDKPIEQDVMEQLSAQNEREPFAATQAPMEMPTLEKESSENGSRAESKRDSEVPSDSQRPAQRSSKRFKERSTETNEAELLRPHQDFAALFYSCTGILEVRLEVELSHLNPEAIPATYPAYMPMLDFYECLNSWTSKHTEFLNQSETKGTSKNKGKGEDSFQLTSLLRSSMFTEENRPTISLTELPYKEVAEFISKVNSNRLHFHAVRLLLLQVLLTVRPDGSCLITDTFWSPILYDTIESFVLSLESNIYDLVYSQSEKYKGLGLSFCEVLMNSLGGIYTEIHSKKLSGGKYGELEAQKNKLEKKIDRWVLLLDQLVFEGKLKFRYLWSKFCYLQCISDVTDDRIIHSLDYITEELRNSSMDIDISYANYEHTPRLNMETVQSQLSKIKMMRKFTMVNQLDVDRNDSSNEDQIEALSRVLVGSSLLDTPEDRSMSEFVNQAPFLLKIKLWRIVLHHYLAVKDQSNFQICYFKVLHVLYERLCSKEYSDQSQLQRQQTLLSTLSLMRSFTSLFIELLSGANEWVIHDTSQACEYFKLLTDVFILLYPLTYFETLSQKSSTTVSFFKKAAKSSVILKDMFVDISCLLVLYFTGACTQKEVVNGAEAATEFIHALHLLIGGFTFCDAANGNFLNLAEHFFCSAEGSSSFIPLKQILLCKYRLSLGGDSNSFEDHGAKPQVLEMHNAVRLAKYLIRFEYQNKNPYLISTNRSNLKQVIENVIDVIGKIPYAENHILARNVYYFEQYLEAPVTAKIIQEALHGRISMELTKPRDNLQEIVDLGLYYISGVQLLNLYKIRKKTLQARPSELDSIIETLKADILYKTNRFETWFLLGKCYSYVVEDDLIWTSDRLVVASKKATTASIQRKAILCYLMALNLCQVSTDDPSLSEAQKMENACIKREIYEVLALELLNAYFKPMEGLSFQRDIAPALVLTEAGELVEPKNSPQPSISSANIYRATLLAFTNADDMYKSSQDVIHNWINPHYIANLRFKHEREAFISDGFDIIIRACTLAMNASTSNDNIIEPHYSLVIKCYKSVKYGWLQPGDALKHLLNDNSFLAQEANFYSHNPEDSVQDFYRKIITLLRRLLALDKRKWHHRPTYRIARILFDDFNDVDGAIQEMGVLMALKSVNKNLVNIWKPEYERPGKHFVYTYQYVMFYLKLLSHKNDYISLGHAARKMRRFGSGMVNGSLATDKAVEMFINGARAALNINEKEHAELLLPTLNYQAFNRYSDELIASFNKESYSYEVLESLAISYQLKKGSSGIAFDGICLSIYFKYLYLPWVEEHEAAEATQSLVKFVEVNKNTNTTENETALPQPATEPQKVTTKQVSSRKRVSKKDAFDKISQIVDKIT
ncbi:AaceriABL081Wp [[Ashbya] aceris (nom. inval.)]|nr:AaceriABL081Wp [[Ashbya] aceris (nom. inval.)]